VLFLAGKKRNFDAGGQVPTFEFGFLRGKPTSEKGDFVFPFGGGRGPVKSFGGEGGGYTKKQKGGPFREPKTGGGGDLICLFG